MVWTWRPQTIVGKASMRRARPIAGVVVAGLVAVACGSATTTTGPTAKSGKVGGKLVVDNESGSTWTCQFNPFNPAVNITSFGFIYEQLEFVKILQKNADGSAKVTPWLAT